MTGGPRNDTDLERTYAVQHAVSEPRILELDQPKVPEHINVPCANLAREPRQVGIGRHTFRYEHIEEI